MLTLLLALLPNASAATLRTCGEAPTTDCLPTLQAAIDAAETGDEIFLALGSYRESVVVDGKSLMVMGSAAEGLFGADGSSQPVIHVRNGGILTVQALLVASNVTQLARVDGGELHLIFSTFVGGGYQPTGGLVAVDSGRFSADFSRLTAGRASEGGLLYLDKSEATLLSSDLEAGDALLTGGAVTARNASSLLIDSSTTLSGNRSEDGGALYGDPTSTLEISRSSLLDNHSEGPVIHAAGDLTIADMRMVGNTAGSSGVRAEGALVLQRSLICGNSVTDAVIDASGEGVTVGHLRLLDNEAGDDPVLDLTLATGAVVVSFSHIASNLAGSGVAINLPQRPEVPATLTALLVAHNRARDVAVSPIGEGGTDPIASNNLFFDNGAASLLEAFNDAQTVYGDPKLRGLQGCPTDAGGLRVTSAAIDAGPLGRLDPDGSRSDIGAGGADGAESWWWADLDGDDSPGAYDCDDGDVNVGPEAWDQPYDGLDADCDGWDDFDSDRDGYAALGWGGEDCDDEEDTINPGELDVVSDEIDQDCSGDYERDGDGDGYDDMEFHDGTDCDDSDPTVHPGAADTDPHRDMDCDGVADIEAPVSPTSCAPGASSLGLFPLLWLFTGRRRRR